MNNNPKPETASSPTFLGTATGHDRESNPRTLLIVDDEEGPRQSLRLIFKDQYDILVASNGQQALELARRRPIDAAILDIRMAGMSGIELLERLKAMDADIEVTILTAYAALETAREALQLGATNYLSKPFDLITIRDTVKKMMDRRALHKRTQANLLQLRELEQEVQRLLGRDAQAKDQGAIHDDVLHDINRPLTVIVGMLSLLNRRLGSLERVEGEEMIQLRERLKTLNHQADSVIYVVQRYLGFLHHDGESAANAEINQVLRDLQELLKMYPGVQDRNLSFHFPPADLAAAVNSTDLLQIMLNLTVNALQATAPAGLVEVSAVLGRGPVDVGHWQDTPTHRFVRSPEFRSRGSVITLSVRDHGTGIPVDVVPKLFDTPMTTKPQGQGVGLGLTIVKRLVLLNQGALLLETALGGGTSVMVFLPVLPPSQREKVLLPSAIPPQVGP